MQATLWYSMVGAYAMVIVLGGVFMYRVIKGARAARQAESIPWRVRRRTGRLRW